MRPIKASYRFFALAMLLGVTGTTSAVAADGPFSSLGGSWSGTGAIMLDNGGKERIRCRATYDVGASGNQLQQSLRCASDSYNFELRSDVEAKGGTISGNWHETRRNVGGQLSGRAQAGRIQVTIDGPSFNAVLTLVAKGNAQTVSITSQGTAMKGVTITLNRS
jgi:hypothetical protein